jgi:AcrR family transcriptional regulator
MNDMNAEPLANTRWGNRRRADSDFARGQILDAAYRCYKRNSVAKTTMEHIAREARVTRTTVYRYFQSRDEVLTEVIMRATVTMAAELQLRTADAPDFGNFIVEAGAGAFELIPESPVLRLLLGENNAVLHRVYVSSEAILALAMDFLRERFERARRDNEVRADIQLAQLTDWIIHIISAYLLAPPAKPDLRPLLRQYLAPALAPR